MWKTVDAEISLRRYDILLDKPYGFNGVGWVFFCPDAISGKQKGAARDNKKWSFMSLF